MGAGAVSATSSAASSTSSSAESSATSSMMHRSAGRKRRARGHDPIKHSGRGQHRYEELRRSQEKLILSVSAGVVLGTLVGFAIGGYYPLTIGTGLALGLAIGILNAS